MKIDDAMVRRALLANMHPLAEPSGTEMRYMRKSLEAALAWQPIETAPTGEGVLVATASGPLVVAYQGPLGWHTLTGQRLSNPTHWMPLPEPPEDAPR